MHKLPTENLYFNMKKLSLYVFLVLMWCNVGFAGFGDKTSVIKCEGYKFKILDHKEKGLRIDSYDKIWKAEQLADSYVNEKGETNYYWFGYYPKAGLYGYRFNLATNKLGVNGFPGLSDNNLTGLLDRAKNDKYNLENQDKRNKKHKDFFFAQLEAYNKLIEKFPSVSKNRTFVEVTCSVRY